MGGTGVIDNFLGVFTQYIDSGFGLVQGDVRWLASVLIAIDITLAGLLWAMAPDEDVLARLIRKTLYIGVFAFILGNYNNLAKIIYNSFAGLGVEAGGGTISASQLLQPGRIAQVGVAAGQPILTAISGLMGFASFFDNFVQIIILLIAWTIVIASFFVMAIQLFVSLIEFKLTTLAGFVLVLFGLFGRTAFLAEKDQVDNHWGTLFEAAILSTLLSIGSEAGANNNESALIQALRQGSSQGFAQVGEQVVGRSLNVQPTITIRPGFPVRVIVNRDLASPTPAEEKTMAKLKLGEIEDLKPVKLTIELPAALHRDLVAYAEVLARETAQATIEPAKLIAPMLARFMATDRAFAKARRTP